MTLPPDADVPAQQLADRLAVLNHIARIMTDVTDLTGALECATAETLKLFPRRDIAVWLTDADHRQLWRASFQSASGGRSIPTGLVFPLTGDHLLERLVHGHQPVSWNEDLGHADSRFCDFLLERCGYHCLTLEPLVGRARFLGLLLVAAPAQQSVCEGAEAELAGAVAHQLAGAVEAAVLLEELQRTNDGLAQQKAFLQNVVDATPGPLFVKDRSGRIILANQAVGDLYGKPSAELVGCMDEDLGIDTDTAREWRAINQAVMDSGTPHQHPEQPIPTVHQDERWFQAVIAPLRDLQGVVQGVIGTLSEITEHKRINEALAQHQRFLQSVIDVSPAAIWVKDLDGRYLLINRAGAAIFGSTPEAMINRTDRQTYLDETLIEEWQAENLRVVETGQTLLIPERLVPGVDAKARWFRVVVAPFEDNQRVSRGVIVSSTEISERVLTEQRLAKVNRELERLAQQDGLTGLANRRNLNRVLDREWRRLRRQGAKLAVAMLDVDYFKAYNDHHGHLAGDDCLRQLATIMAEALQRPADLAGRFGGEEFLILLPDTDQEGALAVAHGINKAVAALAIPHPGSPLGCITVSLGVAVMVPDEESPERLIQAADRALYQAKSAGRDQVAVAPLFD